MTELKDYTIGSMLRQEEMAISSDLNGFSVVEHKVQLHSCVKQGKIDNQVIALLVPDGKPLEYERQLWDYKIKPPTHTRGASFTPEQKIAVDREWAGLVKDVVSFYNSYGGYIVFGISDSPKKIVGMSEDFDVDELNKRVYGFTKIAIECSFRRLQCSDSDGLIHELGLLLLPQRPDSEGIALIRKDGPADKSGKPMFPKGAVYFRKGDSCCPAEEPEDYLFLTSTGRRALSFATAKPISTSPLIHNLPPRDPSFVQFIGRQNNIVDLWRWFLDPFAPIKLVAGIGGVGKTTLVREFSENIVRTSPSGIEKVVWLSAKQQVFTAIQGKFESASRVDFYDVQTLCKSLLSELGTPPATIDEVTDIEDLMSLIIESLELIPAFVIVDDLDSLALETQQEAFHALLQVFTRSSAKGRQPSRCIITARLDLGASPSQLLRVRGLDFPDFAEFVEVNASSIELPIQFSANSGSMKRFYGTTEGSPTFAAAILRLMSFGESLENALNRWKGSDGEEVRKFAFERELNNLIDSQIRTLYAASVLGECYLDELHVVLATSMSSLRDEMAELRKYHLVSSGQATSQGISLVVPGNIQLMRDVVRKRVKDPKRIEVECARLRAQSTDRSLVAKKIIHRVVALWHSNEPDIALDVARQAVKENPTNANLHCLLGTAFLRITPPDYKRAEVAFREANKLGCTRTELPELWVETKIALQDWMGVLEITVPVDGSVANSSTLIHRATAYRQLAKNAENAGNIKAASDFYKTGGKEIDSAFKHKKAVGNVLELKEFKSDFFSSYVMLTDTTSGKVDEHIEVWLAVADSFDCYVRRPMLIKLGIDRLCSWWEAVFQREQYDTKAINLVSSQTRKVRSMISVMDHMTNPNADLIEFVREKLNVLENRIADYSKAYA